MSGRVVTTRWSQVIAEAEMSQQQSIDLPTPTGGVLGEVRL